MYKSEIIPTFIHQTQKKNLKQHIGSEFLSMEDDEVKDETEEEEEEEEQIDYGEDWMKDGGYYLGYDFEKGRTVIVGERPRPVWRSFGPCPPNALTNKRLNRRLAETGRPFLRPDDPLGKSPWNPFPFHVPREDPEA
ncbi:hypothetical protein Hdeb2414_s0027g00694681 [Helianthus debilis subsp. tardiflorus]